MTKLFRHTILLIAAISLFAACDDNAIPSDQMGINGITQGRVEYDTIRNLREASADTIDVAAAVQYGLDSLKPGETSTKYFYVLGMVKGFYQTLDVNYGNASPIITNKISNRQMICYRLKSFNNAKFTSESQLQVGDIVVAYGKIQNRYGVPQLTQGCYLVTSDNPEAEGKTE